MNKYLKNITDIITKNGFHETDIFTYTNNKCGIKIHTIDKDESFFEVINDKGSMFSKSLDIYWLIGVLIYYNYIYNFIK